MSVVRATQTTFTVSVAAIVLDDRSRVLLLEHVLRPSCGWGIPGGLLDSGEQPIDALKREIREEIGIELTDVRLVSAATTRRHVELLFSARPVGEPVVLSREIYRLGWFDVDALPEGMAAPQRAAIERLVKRAV